MLQNPKKMPLTLGERHKSLSFPYGFHLIY